MTCGVVLNTAVYYFFRSLIFNTLNLKKPGVLILLRWWAYGIRAD